MSLAVPTGPQELPKAHFERFMLSFFSLHDIVGVEDDKETQAHITSALSSSAPELAGLRVSTLSMASSGTVLLWNV
jgi:hypothetical protein